MPFNQIECSPAAPNTKRKEGFSSEAVYKMLNLGSSNHLKFDDIMQIFRKVYHSKLWQKMDTEIRVYTFTGLEHWNGLLD